MAHVGKHYKYAFRRDLTSQDFPYLLPERWVYTFDTLIVDNDPGNNRMGAVSDPVDVDEATGKMTWTWSYHGILGSTCTIQFIRTLNPQPFSTAQHNKMLYYNDLTAGEGYWEFNGDNSAEVVTRMPYNFGFPPTIHTTGPYYLTWIPAAGYTLILTAKTW